VPLRARRPPPRADRRDAVTAAADVTHLRAVALVVVCLVVAAVLAVLVHDWWTHR
jgi:hypothetical protein